jgi:hypothetical protein
MALVSMAVAMVLGATSMNDITPLAHHTPVLGPEPSDTTVRRTLELADPALGFAVGVVRLTGTAIMPLPGLTLRAGDGAIIAATGPE